MSKWTSASTFFPDPTATSKRSKWDPPEWWQETASVQEPTHTSTANTIAHSLDTADSSSPPATSNAPLNTIEVLQAPTPRPQFRLKKVPDTTSYLMDGRSV
jgi:hypothetical protein